MLLAHYPICSLYTIILSTSTPPSYHTTTTSQYNTLPYILSTLSTTSTYHLSTTYQQVIHTINIFIHSFTQSNTNIYILLLSYSCYPICSLYTIILSTLSTYHILAIYCHIHIYYLYYSHCILPYQHHKNNILLL